MFVLHAPSSTVTNNFEKDLFHFGNTSIVLAILEHTCNLSDEVVCERWLENPYHCATERTQQPARARAPRRQYR
jgi:hypothetical protein